MKIRAICLIFASTCALCAEGDKRVVQETLNLATAESIALRHSPRISGAYFTAEAAKEKVLEARSSLFPQIKGVVTAVGTGTDISNEFGGGNQTSTQTTRIGASGGLNNPSVFSRESNGLILSQLITDFGRTPNLISAARFLSLSQAEKTKLARAEAEFSTLYERQQRRQRKAQQLQIAKEGQ